MLGLLGFPSQAQRYLETDDDDERLALTALADAALKIFAIFQRNQAVLVVNELGKAMKR